VQVNENGILPMMKDSRQIFGIDQLNENGILSLMIESRHILEKENDETDHLVLDEHPAYRFRHHQAYIHQFRQFSGHK
jgi:hypothetical protein